MKKLLSLTLVSLGLLGTSSIFAAEQVVAQQETIKKTTTIDPLEIQFLDAAKYEDLAKIKTLLEHGVNINATDKDGETALMKAVEKLNFDITQLLIKHGANVVIYDKYGKSSLDKAFWQLDWMLQFNKKNVSKIKTVSEVTNLLIQSALAQKINPNTKNKQGETLLMESARTNLTESVRLLLEHEANVNIQDNNGRTALMHASTENTDCVQLLLKHNANVDIQDNRGMTALMYALLGNPANAQLLIEHGANVNIQDNKHGLSALMLACLSSHTTTELLELLLNHGAEVNAQNKRGHTALMLAAIAIDLFMESCNDIDIRSITEGRPELLKKLLQYKANPNLADKNGLTALDYAQKKNNAEVINLLTPITTKTA